MYKWNTWLVLWYFWLTLQLLNSSKNLFYEFSITLKRLLKCMILFKRKAQWVSVYLYSAHGAFWFFTLVADGLGQLGKE